MGAEVYNVPIMKRAVRTLILQGGWWESRQGVGVSPP